MKLRPSSCAVRGVSRAKCGVSLVAVAAMGIATPAWSQSIDDEQNSSIDSAQSADDSSDDSTIIVTGRRSALEAADGRKRDASVIIDSVVADEAGKLPDNSITEVLQRVAGVAIVRFSALNDPDHFSVEGSGIQVRGLSGVASRLNGRDIFSSNAGRSLLWGDVTPELMQAVDVYKSSSADLIEGGLGGTVDLRTKLPFDFDEGLHLAGTADLSVGDLAEATDYGASGLIAGRWSTGIGDIGFVLDGAYSKLTSNSHFFRMEPYFRTNIDGTDYFIPGGYDFGEQLFERKRDGMYAAVQWAPSNDLTLTGIFFQSRYRNVSNEWASFVTSQALAVDPSMSQFDANNALISSPSVFQRDRDTFEPSGATINSGGTTGVSKNRSKTQDFSLAFDWTPADSRLAIKGGYQHVKSTARADSLSLFRDFTFPTSFGLDLSNGLPVVTTPGLSNDDFTDPTRYIWSAAMPHNEDNTGTMDAVNLDIEYEIGDGFLKAVKAGGRWADRTERDFNNGFAWNALGRGWNGDPQLTFANAAPGDVELHVYDNFFHGAAMVPGNMLYPSLDLTGRLDIDEVHRSPPEGFCGAPFASDLWWNCSPSGALAETGYGNSNYRESGFLLPQDQTDYSTKTLAGYLMVRFGADVGANELEGNAGVRVVNIKNSSEGYFQQFAAGPFIRDGEEFSLIERFAVRSGGAEFTRYLPSVSLNYRTEHDLIARAAYNITMDLPTFSALRANGSLGVDSTTNPNNPPPPGPNLPGIFTNFTTNAGNPELKPAMSNNFDLSLEWYPRSGTTAHIAAFYKRITNLPIYSITQQPVTVYFEDGTTEEAFAKATAVRSATEAATVKGIEIGGRLFFDQLPGVLRGIGFEGNYTYIDSKNPGDLYRDIDGVVRNDAPLQGMSKHNFNLAFLYEHKPFSFRVAYSWRSKYLQSTNSNGTNPSYPYYSAPGVVTNVNGTSDNTQIALPVFGDSYGTLDAGVTVRVNDNFSFNVQGTNLTNSTARTLMGGYPGGSHIRSWFQSDRRVSMGISLVY